MGFVAWRRVVLFAAVAAGAVASCATSSGALPRVASAREHAPTLDEETIESATVCIGSRVHSVGELAPVLYYRRAWLPDGRLAVGYYAFFSDERPWGNNWMTWSVLPALALDLVYTRGAFIGPGFRRLRYGKGDVEGFRIVYRVTDSGELRIDHAVADDDAHHPTILSAGDLLRVDPSRPTVYADTWSHHLGARGATSPADLAYRRCYERGSILPVTDAVTRDFRLAHRAHPADVGPDAGAPPLLRAFARGRVVSGASPN